MAKFNALLLCTLLAFAKDVRMHDVEKIECSKTALSFGCEMNKACTFTCPSTCSNQGDLSLILGTGTYVSDDPLCRSAVHDFRIPNYGSNYSVTFVRQTSKAKKFLPSIQQFVRSNYSRNVTDDKKGIFYFTSPYVSEDILDVSSLSYMNLCPICDIFTQECYINDKSFCREMDFQFYVPATAKHKGFANARGGQETSWLGRHKRPVHPGGYWCHVTNNTYSHAMSIAMPIDADFLPGQWTQTLNINDTAVIRFTPRRHMVKSMNKTWRKDEDSIYDFPNMKQHFEEHSYYLTIENIQVGDGGLYSLSLDGKESTQAITRLIVRRCLAGFFGSKCDQPCPNCKNGGVCHDVMGTCICAPGFTGSNCDIACTAGYFGQKCSHSCAGSNNALDNSCKGALICLPDPYGCSCAPGYHGLGCDKTHASDTGCECCVFRTPCHCAGNLDCKEKSGSCPNGCAEGWKAARCDISYPYLLRPPSLLFAESNRFDIEFPSWDKTQLGEGNPRFYIIEVKDLGSRCNKWIKMKTMHFSTTDEIKDIFATIRNLKQGTRYAVRVVILDHDGHAQRELAPIAVYTTSEYFGIATCHSESRVPGCTIGKTCTVTCTSPCSIPGASPGIWGTAVMQYDAKVCRSAVHDYRLASYSTHKTNVTYVRVNMDTEKYLPTIHRGIISTVYGKLDFPEFGIYYFTSPYITEEILDVSTLNYMYLYKKNGNFIQTCFSTRPIDFQFYIPPTDTIHGVKSSPPGSEKVSWKSADLQPGGYWCNVVDNTYSSVMSLAMAFEADFLPDHWTLTTSIHENVVIRFRSTSRIKIPRSDNPECIRWRKDQKILYSFPNMKLSDCQIHNNEHTLEIENVQFGDGGIYSMGLKDREATQGIMRLIVRRCRSGYFGPTCTKRCPVCQNGGVCHDVMGNCICPPGYSGNNCENLCEADTFGRTCSQSCSSSSNANAIENSCKGALICLPDPFGCSCRAGFTGLACDQLTPDGSIDKTFRGMVASKLQFNPYSIPTTKVKIGLKSADLEQAVLKGLEHLRRTGKSTLTKRGYNSILELRFGGNGLFIQGQLINAGPFGSISIRVDIGFVDMLAKVMIPSTGDVVKSKPRSGTPNQQEQQQPSTGGKPEVLQFDILTIKDIQVTQDGGTPLENERINMLIANLGRAYPSIFQGIVASILPAFAASFVRELNIRDE